MTLALPVRCAAVGFERDADFERALDFEPVAFDRAVGFDRPVGFDRAVALDRAAGFDRADFFALGAEPLDEPLLALFRGLLEAGLLLAILIPLLDSGTRLPRRGYPV